MNRALLFVLGLVAWSGATWWVLGHGSPDALSYVLIFGMFFGLPTVLLAAAAEVVATALFPRRPALAFAVIAAGATAIFISVMQFGPGHPANKPFASAASGVGFLMTICAPMLAVAAVYTIGLALRAAGKVAGKMASKADQPGDQLSGPAAPP